MVEPAASRPSESSVPVVVGAVLTGGSSRRMGRDKALVRVDGRPLVGVAADALHAAGVTEVLLIGGDRDALRGATRNARPVADLHPGEGPLGGILTAFDAVRRSTTPSALVAVVACDMPRLDGPTVRSLVEAAVSDPRTAVAAAEIDGRPQPLTAVWRPAVAGPVLLEAFAAGERAPRRLLHRLRVVAVEGLDPEAVADVDSPDDLARYAASVDRGARRGHWPTSPQLPDEVL